MENQEQDINETDEREVMQALDTSPMTYIVATEFAMMELTPSVYPDGSGRGVSMWVRETDPDPVHPNSVDIFLHDASSLRKLSEWFKAAADWAEKSRKTDYEQRHTKTRIIGAGAGDMK
jgi:hypothetical protein